MDLKFVQRLAKHTDTGSECRNLINECLIKYGTDYCIGKKSSL